MKHSRSIAMAPPQLTMDEYAAFIEDSLSRCDQTKAAQQKAIEEQIISQFCITDEAHHNRDMKHRVRIGTVQDQDTWRRDDIRALSPNQRVDMLLAMQSQYFNNAPRPLTRVASIKSNNAKTF